MKSQTVFRLAGPVRRAWILGPPSSCTIVLGPYTYPTMLPSMAWMRYLPLLACSCSELRSLLTLVLHPIPTKRCKCLNSSLCFLRPILISSLPSYPSELKQIQLGSASLVSASYVRCSIPNPANPIQLFWSPRLRDLTAACGLARWCLNSSQ
jgi:hypothetical protein